MQVSRWGNSLGIRLPRALVEKLGLRPGDRVEIVAAEPGRIALARDDGRERAIARMRARGLVPPPGWRFDREEANLRSSDEADLRSSDEADLRSSDEADLRSDGNGTARR